VLRSAVALVVAVVIVGCAGSDGGSSDTTSPPDATATSEATTTSTAPPETAPPTVASTIAPTTTTTTEEPVELSIPTPEASTVVELLALDRPVMLAHAGGDFDGPHSTLFAFTEAVIAGIDALEMDVRLSSDGVLMVHHDETVDRTTEASGRVDEFTAEELAALDNAYWFSGDTWVDKSLPDASYLYRGVRSGQQPPPDGYSADDFAIATFQEVAECFPERVLDVEIKIPDDPDGEPDLDAAIEIAQALAVEIAELNRTDSVIAVSFADEAMVAFRTFAPGVATSPGTDTLTAWYAGADHEFAPQDVVFQAPPFFDGLEVLTTETIDRARADGFGIWAWMDDASTQETAEFYRELIARGIDGIIASRNSEAVAALTPTE
jgi:glycerophosphoryl diester phosphodiesterase